MKKGLTLIEILVSIAILTIVIAGIFAVLNLGDMTWHSDMGLVDLQQAGRQAMDGMVREVRQSRTSDITISEPGPDTGAKIQFIIPLDITTDPITYSETISYYRNSSNQLIREYPQGETKVLANYIDSLSFSLSGYLVQIQLSAEKTVRNRTLSFPLTGVFTEQVKLRNP